MSLGQRIEQLRKEIDMSQRKLSEKSGISYSLIHSIESGERMPSKEAIVSLARALRHSDVAELFRLAGIEPGDTV